jgi:hypothetical protein
MQGQPLTTTDVLAIIGAVTGIIGTIAGLLALGWDYYKWRYAERVLLRVWATPGFVSTSDPRRTPFIMVSVTNIGKIPTTLKIISLHGFESKWGMRKRNGKKAAIVPTPLYSQLPVRLEPGNDWGDGVSQDSEVIKEFLSYKYFVIQIEDTMSKKPFRAIVDKSLIKELPAKKR